MTSPTDPTDPTDRTDPTDQPDQTDHTDQRPAVARRAGIVGLGLIGGSIGLALRRAGWHVTGVDRDAPTAQRARELGAVDAVGVDTRAGVTFVATPVGSVPAAARDALASGRGAVSDVGGVKARVVAAVDHPRFVGGHPMAGSELDGIDGADADLFRGAAWVLTPTAHTDPDAFGAVHAAVSAMGAEVVAVDPVRHDAIVAVVSHVPHLTAAALMGVAEGHARAQQGPLLRLAAGGFRDMTRIAAGATGIWPDVCADNAEAITAVLDELLVALAGIRAMVAAQRRDDLVAVLERARAARLGLPGRTLRPAGEAVELRIPVPNREGVLADVTTLATRLGVNIEALETADATEHERGLIVMVVETAAGHRLRDSLVERGYHPSIRPLE